MATDCTILSIEKTTSSGQYGVLDLGGKNTGTNGIQEPFAVGVLLFDNSNSGRGDHAISIICARRDNDNNAGSLAFNPIDSNKGNYQAMRMGSSGNVGLGSTTSPAEKLEVDGNSKVRSSDSYLIGSVKICTYAGSPEGYVTAPVGSLCLNTYGGSGTMLYVKESGTNTYGWVAK